MSQRLAPVPPLETLPDLLTTEEAQRVLRCGRNFLYKGLGNGSIPSVRIGRLYFVPKAKLEKLLAGETSK